MRLVILLSTVLITACQTVILPVRNVQNNLKTNLSPEIILAVGELPEKLTLTDAKALALKSNPDIQAAGQRIKRAKAILDQSFAAYSPTIRATGGIRHQHLTPETVNGIQVDQSDTYSAGLAASWVVFDGLIREYRVLAAKYSELSSAEQFRNTKRLLFDAVSLAYFQTILSSKQMEINLELKKINEEFLNDTKIKFDAGAATRTEVNNFLVNVNNSQISYLDAKDAFETAKLILAELLGLPGVNTDKFIPVFKSSKVTVPDVKTALGMALHNRPDLKALQADIMTVEAQAKQAEGEYYPTLTIDSFYGYQGLNQAEFGDDRRNSNISANVNWNLFTGNSTAALIRQRQAEKETQLAILKATWNEIISQIRQQHYSLKNAQEKLKVQIETVKLSKIIYDDTKEIFNNGATTITRVNEVLTDYTVSRLNQVLFEIETHRRKEILNALMGTNDK